MAVIPQRELRNNVSDVLRRAEAGERLTVTVNGRPVAELGPIHSPPRFGRPERLREIMAEAPADGSWLNELMEMRREDAEAAREPWDE